LENFQI